MFLNIIQGGNYSSEEGNYSREETIIFYEGLTEETIQRRKLFKGGNYMRKYGMHNS